ncbi:hypothetical protein V8E51_005198 [Hyaloscypha variabilis]
MPRLSHIIGFIIAAIAVLTVILSEVSERQEAAERLRIRKYIAELCSWLDLRQANHITKSPRLVALSIPLPWQMHKPYDQTTRICGISETVLAFPEAMAALFDGIKMELTCATTSDKPASALALLTTTYVPEEPTTTSDGHFPQETGI